MHLQNLLGSKMKKTTFDSAFEEVKKLVAKFKQGENHYLSQAYSEAAVRQDFLDDFFTALGWDVGHDYQHDPYEQEVKIENLCNNEAFQPKVFET